MSIAGKSVSIAGPLIFLDTSPFHLPPDHVSINTSLLSISPHHRQTEFDQISLSLSLSLNLTPLHYQKQLDFHLYIYLYPISRQCRLFQAFFGNRRTNVFDPFSLDIWDPFQDFPLIPTTATTALSVPRSEFASETAVFANTRIDWKETPEAHVFKADLPGLKKEEVKVEVEEGRVLQISGERNKEKEDKNDTWHRVERSSGRFLRRFRLPENAKVDQVKASMENGVLTVTVPKEEVKKPDVKAIDISG